MRSAREYYRRLTLWHGETDGPERVLEIFGHDLSQSEIFGDIDRELDRDGSDQ